MSNDLLTLENTNIAYMKAELDTAITTANAFKRDIPTFMKEATALITYSEEVAASCIFALPRKKKNEVTGKYENVFLKGKSVRLSEIILSTYENLTVGSRVINVNAKTVTVEGGCWDLQRRTKFTAEVVENINGTHSDAQKLAIGSATSKAIRNAIFRVVGPLAEILYKVAVEHVVGDQKTFPVKRQKVFDRFKTMEIMPEKIFAFYNKTCIEDFTPEMLEEIIGVGTAIKEGELKIDKAFVKESTSNDAADRVNSVITPKAAVAEAVNTMLDEVVTAGQEVGINPETGEVLQDDTFKSVKHQLQQARSSDELDVAIDRAREVTDKVLHSELVGLYNARRAGFASV